jgi:hypothetical protein
MGRIMTAGKSARGFAVYSAPATAADHMLAKIADTAF